MTRFRNMKFRNKMLIINFALFLPMAISGFALLGLGKKQTLESTARHQLKQADNALLFFNLALHNMENTAKTLAESGLFAEDRTNEEITKTLKNVKERCGYTSVSYFTQGRAGVICAASSDERRRGTRIKSRPGEDDERDVQISDPGGGRAEIVFVSPVKAGNGSAGFVELRARLDKFLALSETIDAPNIRSTILSRDGKIIYTNCPELRNTAGVNDAVRIPSVLAAMEGKEGHLFERHGGKEFLSVYAQSGGVGDWPGYGWKLILSLNKAELLEPARKREIVLTGAFLAVTILLILAAFYFSRLIMRPLRNLLETVRNMEAGNMVKRAEIESEDEIGAFAAAFNKAADKLSEVLASKDRLAAELRETNERLAAESQQLEVMNEELKASEEELTVTNEDLKAKRENLETLYAKLQNSNRELERFNKIAVGRELRMAELKKRIRNSEGQKPKRPRRRGGRKAGK